MGEWWEPDEPAALVKEPAAKLLLPSRDEIVRGAELEVHQEAVTVIRDVMRFNELSDAELAAPGPPEWMIEECGGDVKVAGRRFRTARGAAMSAKDAPIAIKLSKDILVGMAKVRSMEKTAPKNLNVMVVQLSQPLPVFDSIEVEPPND